MVQVDEREVLKVWRVGKWQTVQMVQVIKRPVAQVIPVIKPRTVQSLQMVGRQWRNQGK